MINRTVKIGANIQYNFNTSLDIGYWSIKYNSSLDEIQKIFNDCGNSISRTIEILRERQEAKQQ
jgi:hypothetical protein